ncbi:MAG TPA: Uma2 family endonuclease [Pseudonocardiaceae bacterium]|jgi:Uma2 family endonuclease|nr:Uma2 family endonuclease [Pseudonocardiaceae bacterium]
MRAVLLEVPAAMLDERHRLELDGRDELWNGVLHIVPPPGGPHQEVGGELFLVLGPLAKHYGLRPHYETGLFGADDDYRVPDQLYCRPEQQSDRGAEGAQLVVEIRSKGDETYDKIGFYAELGVREMLIVHPAGRWVELLRAVGGRLLPVSADAEGAVRSDVLDARFATVEGRLRVTWRDGVADV